MEQKNDFLGTESIGKLLWKLSVPAIAAQLINLLYNLVDRVYIGHIPDTGALALTGVGVCMPVIMIVSAFSAFVSSGSAPRASIAMGAGKQEEAEKILSGSFAIQLLASLVLTIALLLFHRPLLLAFGASGNTIEFAAEYMRIYAMGTVFVQLTLGMNAFVTAQGFAKTGMLSVVAGAVSNIILDPILIYGLHMGVQGAALATILSQAISTIIIIRFLTGKKTIIRIKKRYMKPEGKIMFPCIALGIAPFIMQASESIIMICFNASLLKYGGDVAVGAMTILSSVMQFSSLPIQGLGQGAQPISSYNYGAKNAARVKKTFRLLLLSTLVYSLSVWGLVMLFPQVFVRIFSSDAQLIGYASHVLRIYCAAMGIFGAQIACQMTFNAVGNAKASIMVAVMRKFILLLPLIYLLPRVVSDPAMGVYLAEPVADVAAVSFTVILFSLQFRKAMKQLENGL